MGRLAEGRVEQAMEMKWREACFAGGGIEKNLGLEPFCQKIARTAEPAKGFVVHQRPRWLPLWHGFIVLRKWRKKATGK
jgi:hypothetical protein